MHMQRVTRPTPGPSLVPVLTLVLTLSLALSLPMRAEAQEGRGETLADIRQQLSVLYVEVQRLNRELSTTGGAGGTLGAGGTVGAGSMLDRVNAMESELQRLTAKTEELEFSIQSVVRDGTNRIGDLEFRLCELETTCDISQLSEGSTLGGIAVLQGATPGPGAGSVTPDVQLAVGERADFERAEEALAAGNWAQAAGLFENFGKTYPGSPLSERAGLNLGAAREGTGDMAAAARAYLDVFTAAPEGPVAPDALYKLGRSLGALGKTSEACVTLGEVEARFPGSQAVQEAQSEMRNLGCS